MSSDLTPSEYSESLKDSENPVKEPESKQSKLSLSSLNPFHRKKKEEEEIPPKLKEAMEQMEARKQAKLKEMEEKGQKPNMRSRNDYGPAVAIGAIGSLGGGGC